MKRDALAAWNTADWTAGLFIRVPENTVVEKPIVVHYVNDTTPGEVVATNRNLVLIGKSSEVTIVEKFNSSGPGNHFTNLVNEIVVHENDKLEYYSIQNDKGNKFHISQTAILQKNNSRVKSNQIDIKDKMKPH